MTGNTDRRTVGALSNESGSSSLAPVVFTRLVWLLWLASLGVVGALVRAGDGWAVSGLVNVDGLTVVMWVTVTFFSGIVHSYARRYMAGNETIDRFFRNVFAFTLLVMVLVAADSLALFGAAWLAMGMVMAELVGHVEGWPAARTARTLARRYFLASTTVLVAGLVVLWWHTGATTVSGLDGELGSLSTPVVLFASSMLLLAAMTQSSLVPFHRWMVSSMTAPTPASALMHAGFVNAGGILLVRFAPVVTVEPAFMLLVVIVGAASAVLGKLLKTVQADIKAQLGCSTVGQMGFMIMQVGLGFFAAAIAHLILHGFYKAYEFLSSGARVEQTAPGESGSGSMGVTGIAVMAVTALAGGALFAVLTGKGTDGDSGLLLTMLVVLTVLHAVRELFDGTATTAGVRYGTVPLVALPAIVVYAAIFTVISELLADLPGVGYTADLTVAHALVAVGFVVAYIVVETGVYRRSERLYVALMNTTRPPAGTLLNDTEEYNEY